MQKPARSTLYYIVAMIGAIALIVGIQQLGPEAIPGTVLPMAGGSGWLGSLQGELARNFASPMVGLITQLLVILVFCRLTSAVLSRFGQPSVIAEMLAGILLGKSVLAAIWPAGFATVFPEASMPRLFFLSQIGLVFFMFVVGLNLKVSELKSRGSSAVLISHVSIVVPFLLGTVLALSLYKTYGPTKYDFSSFALFMGIAMSITAFPVLARIIQEKRLMETSLGAMALTCAAVDDVTAWCVLAAVVGIVKAGSAATAIAVLAAALVYVGLMLKVVQPLVQKALRPATIDGEFTPGQLAFLFCVLLGSAFAAELIGIHALFGAFMAGTIMPRSVSFRSNLIAKIEDVTAVFFLPIFFAYTGLRTQIGLLDTPSAWLVCGAVTACAIVGKMAGSAIAARATGMPWRDSLALGSLMNTRGLMELVVLNIGYDLGVLSPTLFAMLVIMALVTTMMTSPLLALFVPELVGRQNGARGEARNFNSAGELSRP